MPALRLAERTDDDATDMTLTDVVAGATAPFVDPESVEEGPAAAAMRAPFGGGDPGRSSPVMSVVIIDDEDDYDDVLDARSLNELTDEDDEDDDDDATCAEGSSHAGPAAAAGPAAPAGNALELRVLRSELLRLRKDLDSLRHEREVALQEVMAASSEAREAQQEIADWRAVAQRAEARVRMLEAKAAHYCTFAESSIWTRLQGCAPFSSGA